MGVLAWILIGLIAGWLASRITGARGGLLRNLLVGLVGALLGGFLFRKLNIGVAPDFWGALITGLSTVLPALAPVIGIDITADLVREAGEKIVETTQTVGGLIGLVMTIYGRVRASQPLTQRVMSLKL